MNVTIIGWYGTETIGDRAILIGILSFLNKALNRKVSIKLGSLNPYFSERSIKEDKSFIDRVCNNNINVDIFDSQSFSALKDNLSSSEFLIMGGGPLMDLRELSLVEYAFKYANKKNIKSFVMGCGVGPLFEKSMRKQVLNIMELADSIVLRDSKSKENLKDIYGEFNCPFNAEKVNVSYDPAVECTLQYKKNKKIQSSKYIDSIVVNLREFPSEYSEVISPEDVNKKLLRFIKDLTTKFKGKDIYLIPMHYYFIGKDDRVFFGRILEELIAENCSENVYIQQENLSLEDTIMAFESSFINFGMRFHAVVLQTVSAGNNFILDYTQPGKGKINGFIDDIDKHGFYANRYISLQGGNIDIQEFDFSNLTESFSISNESIDLRNKIYLDEIIKNAN